MMTAFEVEAFEALVSEASKLALPVLELLRARIDSLIGAHTVETRQQAVTAVRAEGEQVIDEMERVIPAK